MRINPRLVAFGLTLGSMHGVRLNDHSASRAVSEPMAPADMGRAENSDGSRFLVSGLCYHKVGFARRLGGCVAGRRSTHSRPGEQVPFPFSRAIEVKSSPDSV
jgi:hypothetical protein